jgi:hypothetical protein
MKPSTTLSENGPKFVLKLNLGRRRTSMQVGRFLFALAMLAGSLKAAQQDPDDLWKLFRQQNPSPYQVLALSEPHDGGTRVLIISEPRLQVSFAALRAIDPELLDNAKVHTQRIGIDGWVRDVVMGLPFSSSASSPKRSTPGLSSHSALRLHLCFSEADTSLV